MQNIGKNTRVVGYDSTIGIDRKLNGLPKFLSMLELKSHTSSN